MISDLLLDTNVASEPSRLHPDPEVVHWLRTQPVDSMFLSAISVGELRKGIELLAPGRRRSSLEQWLHYDLLLPAAGRILPVTQSIADHWGTLTAARQLAGNPLGLADGLIAATALHHHLTLVTRNTKHFRHLGIPLLNPWNLAPQPT